MTHVQETDFVFRRNGLVHLNLRGPQLSTTGSRGVRISSSNAGYTMFRRSVKGTGYPIHSPVSPSLPLPCVTVCHHISPGLYLVQRSVETVSSHCTCRPVNIGFTRDLELLQLRRYTFQCTGLCLRAEARKYLKT